MLLDGWKDLYTQVLELIEPRLVPGALVVADNTSMPGLQPYVDYMRDPANGYVSEASRPGIPTAWRSPAGPDDDHRTNSPMTACAARSPASTAPSM